MPVLVKFGLQAIRKYLFPFKLKRRCVYDLQTVQIFRLPDQKLLSVIEGVDCTQPILSSELPRRSTAHEQLVEAVVADLGDSTISYPYLIVRQISLVS